MAEKYEKIIDPNGNIILGTIRRVSDNAYIPMDERNCDYQLFLASGAKLADPPAREQEPAREEVSKDEILAQIDELRVKAEAIEE
jgi:hypothetical protein